MTRSGVQRPPRVSVVIPALDEEQHVDACLRSVLSQQVDGELEVLVVDGLSADRTAAIARRAGAVVLPNPERTIPTALNRGLAAARGDVLVRFDAHAVMPPGYVEACLRALAEEDRAANVGGWRQVRAEGPWGRAVGAALASRFGVGNPRIWRSPRDARRHDVDTVPLGCFPVAVLRSAGGWSTALGANEDFDLNRRLRDAGGRVVFDPEIWSIYYPRESFGALMRQYWRYGRWKAVVLRRAPSSVRPRQLAPIVLLIVAGGAAAPGPQAAVCRAGVGAYVAVLLAVALHSRAGWRVFPTLGAMHSAWAAGLVVGLFGSEQT